MTETLPQPKSRKESYLAKAAGMDVTVPEEPRSRLEQYLNAIAEGGGGGGTSDFDQLTNRPKYNGAPMTGETNIPESTSYTAGDGIDIVAGVIKATNTGKARVLTADDYNWPTSNPTSVALWLLEPGIYTWDRGLVVDANYDVNVSSYGYTTALVGGVSGANSEFIVFGDSTNDPHTYITAESTGAPRGGSSILTTARIVDALDSTATSRPLSANQGKVLNEKIEGRVIQNAGAPTTSTAGTIGLLLEDTTNGQLYVCTDIDNTDPSNPVYTWKEVGSDTVKELTSADYNYPTDNPDGIAIWELSGGVYECVAGVKKYFSTTNSNEASGMVFVDEDEPSSMFFSGYNNGLYMYRTNRRGVIVSGWPKNVLTNMDVVQSTGTSTSSVMSQNAVTSMVFQDPSTKNRVQIGGSAVGAYSTAIGSRAQTGFNAQASVAIGTGYDTTAVDGSFAVGVGVRASVPASRTGSIALGSYSGDNINADGMIDVGSSWTGAGYNSSNYRLLTGLYDGQSAHDAATYGQVISYSAINGAGAPTTATEGKYVGQLYYDTTNEAMYFLKTIDTTTTPATYTWEALGGGPTVVQTTGTSTTSVMSQNAVTSMVFSDSGNRARIRIGAYASSGNEDGIAIGKVASLNAAKSIAIGASASATGQESIALGDGSSATQKGQMDIGAAGTTYGGYNNSNYRLLTGLYDGQSAHDAVNLGQLQNAIINGGTSAPTTTTVGAVGTQYTYVDTTGTPTAHLCVCTEIDTTDPSNPVYTWSTLI